jgi:hypothetical protein
MKTLIFLTLALLALTAVGLTAASGSSSIPDMRTPVLVEPFTSEGCSSCPPAAAILQKLDRQPVAGEELIVLSEHVDYWNHIGWKGPYSARFYSDRQGAYAKRLRLDSVYTPKVYTSQIVVDGSSEFVGGDAALAEEVFAKERGKPKLAVRLSSVSLGSTSLLLAHLETDSLQGSFGLREADVYAAVALNRAESQVVHGEKPAAP